MAIDPIRREPECVTDEGPTPWTQISPATTLRFGFASQERRRRTLDWLGRGLRPERPGRLALEYPLLFERGSVAVPITLFAGDRPAAFCMLWPVHFRIGVSRLAIGLVSLVYTDPDARGRGYARRVIEAAVDRAERLGLGLVLLWSDLERLYRGTGFDRAGVESLLVLDRSVLDRAADRLPGGIEVEIDAPGSEDWPLIERLRDDRMTQLELDRGDVGRFARVPDLAARVARHDGRLAGFALRGRGDDLQEVIHEWGGELAASLACCRSLAADLAPHEEIFLLADGQAQDLLPWTLRCAGARLIRQPLAWGRIARSTALARDLRGALDGLDRLEIETLDRCPGGSRIELRSEHGRVEATQQTLLDALLGSVDPVATRTALRRLAPALGQTAVAQLPLPFFVWGLESI